jgi:hypothetical protein
MMRYQFAALAAGESRMPINITQGRPTRDAFAAASDPAPGFKSSDGT